MSAIEMLQPDDWHVHLRDGAMLKAVAPYSASVFHRLLVMPNLKPPVVNTAMALSYRDRILDALGEARDRVELLMTLYLTDQTTERDIEEAAESGVIVAAKLYPAGATTNSAFGVTNLDNLFPILAAMEKNNLVLCIHGERTDPDIDMFDREAAFVKRDLPSLRERCPNLRIVLEHCTTEEAVEYIKKDTSGRLAGTITIHHLLFSRQALFEGSRLRPHMYCLPILKEEKHRLALLEAIRSDDDGKFFLGTDSAPHLTTDKESAQAGCAAGVFSSPGAIQLYAGVFEDAGIVHRLESFCSRNGAVFYGFPVNTNRIRLDRRPTPVPSTISVGGGPGEIVPLRAGETLRWTATILS